MALALDFGSLNPLLSRVRYDGLTINLLDSAGPISDAYIMGQDALAVIEGPIGSGKTIASVKKGLVSAQRMVPIGATSSGRSLRRYVLGVWREKYDSLWKGTIPSWNKVFPKDLPDSEWTGASPRAAQHIIRFDDDFGRIEFIAMFRAFGEIADPEDTRGLEFSDNYLNEIDLMPEDLLIALFGRVGREPPRELMRRSGRIFGDMNAPDVTGWAYQHLHEEPKPGYVLYRQPGGLSPGAENLKAVGRAYYEDLAARNAHQPWYVRRMVHNIPGMITGAHLVYAAYDDERMFATATLDAYPQLPVIVGIDGGFTPAAVYCQEMSDGQLRVLAEIGLSRGGPEELGTAMLALEARRFRECEFVTVCDPSMLAGEEVDSGPALEKGSDRRRLEAALGRKVRAARTNEASPRWEAVRDKIALNLGPGRPGLYIDPSCKILRRGFLQTYKLMETRGTDDLTRVAKTFDSHVHDGLQYVGLECGSALARKRQSDIKRDREKRRAAAGPPKPYRPHDLVRRGGR